MFVNVLPHIIKLTHNCSHRTAYQICVKFSLPKFTWLLSVSEVFGHRLSHLKLEFHVVMHLSQRRLQMRCENINLSSWNALAFKGDGRWHSHWFIACYAQNTPTGNYATCEKELSSRTLLLLKSISLLKTQHNCRVTCTTPAPPV